MLESLFFDYYACGIDQNITKIKDSFSGSYPLGTWEFIKPMQGYTHAAALLSPDMKPYCTLWWGGDSQGTMVHAFATGSMAHTFASVVRLHFPIHRLSRADIAVDYDDSGTWPSFHSLALNLYSNKFVRKYPAYHGDLGQESIDTPHGPGRTIYLGSRQSVHYVRFYEKGKKDDKTRPNWCRAEVEFKPRGDSRYEYALASPAEMMAATPLGSELLRILLDEVAIRPCAAGAMRTPSDRQKSIDALRKQWGPFIQTLLEDHFSGDINACLSSLLLDAGTMLEDAA